MLAAMALLLVVSPVRAGEAASGSTPTTSPAEAGPGGKLPHVQVDVTKKQVRVECASCKADYGLEFFCCATGTNEYESVVSTSAKPSHIHLALLMIGLQPGAPAKYDEATNQWTPPHGPPLNITCEYQKDGKTVSVPSYKLMRDVKTREAAPAMTWVFAGSEVLGDGKYAADATGSIISILTSTRAVITLPDLASTALEDREWQTNPDTLPPPGTSMWMVIEPAKEAINPPKSPKPATRPSVWHS